MEYTDWLLKNEDSIVAEEDLDKPYAFYERIYTRREFEQIRDRADEAKKRAKAAVKEEEENNETLFFENFGYVLANSELILADAELANSQPISFMILVPWIGGDSFTLGEKLQSWKEEGGRKCPYCGEQGYFINVCAHRENIYCPKCNKKIVLMESDEDHRARTKAIVERRRQKREAAEALDKLETGKSASEKIAEERKSAKTEEEKREMIVRSFKEVYKLWEKTEHTSHEEYVAHARLGVAQMHGESIRKWLCETEEAEKKYQECEDIKQGRKLSDTGKLLVRIKELRKNSGKTRL